MDWKLELVLIPVTDVDRAKHFYSEQLGFHLDVDHQASEAFRIVQLTPPGSGCSIAFGIGMSSAEPGTVKGLQLVVSDIEAARNQLLAGGVDVGEIQHFENGAMVAGKVDKDYESFLFFDDPDGNSWAVQGVPSRA